MPLSSYIFFSLPVSGTDPRHADGRCSWSEITYTCDRHGRDRHENFKNLVFDGAKYKEKRYSDIRTPEGSG